MKLKLLTCIIGSFVFLNVHAKDNNYFHYHNLINRAETNFFLHENVDSAIWLYKKAFKDFDFVFAKDCVMAAQIAVYAKRNDAAVLFIERGFEQGVRFEQLKQIKLFREWLVEKTIQNKLANDYAQLRKKYLKKINIPILKTISVYYFNWRLLGNVVLPDKEERRLQEIRFVDVGLNNIRLVDSLIKTVGYPGEKFIGVDQNDILKELGYPDADVLALYRQLSEKEKAAYLKVCFDPQNPEESFLVGIIDMEMKNNYTFAQDRTFLLMTNNYPCAYYRFKALWLSEIKKGNIHPRDIACFHDRASFVLSRYEPNTNPILYNPKLGCNVYQLDKGYYYSIEEDFDDYYQMKDSKLWSPSNPDGVCLAMFPTIPDTKEINEMRRALYMVDYEVDAAKQLYIKKGFQVRFGQYGQL